MGRQFEGEPIIRQILDLLSVYELSRQQIIDQLGITQKKAERMLDVMKSRGLIENIGHMHTSRWVLVSKMQKAPQPNVNLPARTEWTQPAVHTKEVNGVKITIAKTPPGRFDVTLPRGQGVISQDWKARRLAEVQQ